MKVITFLLTRRYYMYSSSYPVTLGTAPQSSSRERSLKPHVTGAKLQDKKKYPRKINEIKFYFMVSLIKLNVAATNRLIEVLQLTCIYDENLFFLYNNNNNINKTVIRQ